MFAVSVSIHQTHFNIHLCIAICYAITEGCKIIRIGFIRTGGSNFMFVMPQVIASLLPGKKTYSLAITFWENLL
jgi:hypothetical protein